MSKKIMDLEAGDTLYSYNRRTIKKLTIKSVKKPSGWLDFKFTEKADFSTIKTDEFKNDKLYFLIDQYFVTTDEQILLKESKKVYFEERSKAKQIAMVWFLELLKQKRF